MKTYIYSMILGFVMDLITNSENVTPLIINGMTIKVNEYTFDLCVTRDKELLACGNLYWLYEVLSEKNITEKQSYELMRLINKQVIEIYNIIIKQGNQV